MSMLSENRRKAKWTLNPRGNLWSQDESKFGQKMLEKMGWEKGKGLGANQQGRVDIISVKTKDEKQGVGFDHKHEEKWIAHQDDFAAVLAGLNQTHGAETSQNKNEEVSNDANETVSTDVNVESLENKSKKTRKRVHYHKFTRGKDLTNYSTTDLSCILGSEAVVKKRKMDKEDSIPNTPSATNPPSSDDDDEDGEMARPSFNLGSDSPVVPNSPVGVKTDGGLVVIAGGNINDYFAKKMMELRNRNNKINYPNFTSSVSVSKNDDNSSSIKESLINDNDLEDKKLKKKKKKDKSKNISKEKEPDVQKEEEQPIKKKKKSKDKSKSKENTLDEIEEKIAEDSCIKKKKKKKSKGYENITENSENVEEVIEEKPNKKKKKKKAEKVVENEPEKPDETIKKKKKKDKRKSGEIFNGTNLFSIAGYGKM